MDLQRFIATAPKHMERLLAEELVQLGAGEVSELLGGVAFHATLETAYRACLWSRVANRVLLPLAQFSAPTADALYTGVQSIPWDEHFSTTDSFAVDCNTTRSKVSHSHFAALKVKDAIADQFRSRQGIRPSVALERPAIRVNLYLSHDQATVSLDLSGESLHRRGYRSLGVSAPLKENLAAAILLRAGWPELASRGVPLLDPMCGSGTLLIEGAMMAADIAPGLLRDYWGFLGWRQHDPGVWQCLLLDAAERKERGLAALPPIRGCDRDPQAARTGRENLAQAGLTGRIDIRNSDMARARPQEWSLPGLLVTNPPYGERLGRESDLTVLYSQLGTALREQFAGWRAAVFLANPQLGKSLGLRARKIHTLYNGAIECKLLHFEISPEFYVENRRFPAPLAAESRGEGASAFANRLRKNLKHLGRWSRREGVTCYRLYDADLPEYAFAVDLYQGAESWVHVQEYQAPGNVDPQRAKVRLREALGVILELLSIAEDQLFFKVRRPQKRGQQYQKFSSTGTFFEVAEGGCRFLVNLEDYLDTGLFLDHRLTRRMLGEIAAGKHVLNLFSYTGTASVYAAAGGALSTTSVDLSKTYFEWAKRNMALNGFRGPEHRFIQADCMEWLNQPGVGERYDVIFLDPPSHSSSKRMTGTLDLQRDHPELIRAAARKLAPAGVLIFSNNLRRFRIDRKALSGLEVEDISRATLPKDYERNPKIHNWWRIRLSGQ